MAPGTSREKKSNPSCRHRLACAMWADPQRPRVLSVIGSYMRTRKEPSSMMP